MKASTQNVVQEIKAVFFEKDKLTFRDMRIRKVSRPDGCVEGPASFRIDFMSPRAEWWAKSVFKGWRTFLTCYVKMWRQSIKKGLK